MTHSIKITVMAIAAMFAFSNAANAQFGLLKKAVKDVAPAKKKTVQVIAYDENYNLKKNETMLTFTLPGTDKKVMAIVPASYTVKSYEAFEGQAWEDKDFMAHAKAAIAADVRIVALFICTRGCRPDRERALRPVRTRT